MGYTEVLNGMRRYFESGITQPYDFRMKQLRKLKEAILRHEEDLYEALNADLKKNREEVWITETGNVLTELKLAIRELRNWMRPERVGTNLLNLPSVSYIHREPLGVVLIIGPWNYPFQLLFNPLIGALAAGNCVVLKPSEFAPATEEVMKKIIEETFPPQLVFYAPGEGHAVVPEMMIPFRFNHVFYTGSTEVGKIIYKMAAEHLVPVTLELGGKSPCMVESDANLKVAARRIVVTKFSNAGQMCVAPDYVLVHESVKDRLLQEIRSCIRKFYGDNPVESYNYGRIITERQFHRLEEYLGQGTVFTGGKTDQEKRFIEPTVLTDVSPDAPVMREEIFGPILPVFSFRNREEALALIRQHPDPLSFYLYTSSAAKEKEWLQAVPAGGACINNCSWHLTNHQLPFGGRGPSGMGRYHGRYSFETFSHLKSVMKTPTWFDPDLKYPPLKGRLGLFKKVIG